MAQQTSRTFRIFVSSTFSDLKAERNALQERVFPRLRDLAAAHGCRFQAIDLRWGVSEEAALDQQTMKICLGEIARCQSTSPRPNFIVLLGDRYGWQPIPSEIPADEFEQIIPLVAKEEKNLLGQWYRRDDNAVPPVYLLQPRTNEFIEFEHWEQVEAKLRQTFQSAIKKISLSPDAALKYTTSATEQEIVAGALNVPDANDHVFCFMRGLNGIPDDISTASFREIDPEATQKQTELKARLRRQLSGNVHEYTAQWKADGPSQEHIDPLCEDVYAELSKVILAETGKLEKVDPLDAEIAAHETFGKDRARIFIGRAEILKAIEKYITGNDPHPLAIWGASGSGKSALMAKAVEQAQKNGRDVLYRFIGATPESSNGRALLESLCKQISRLYDADRTTIPSEYKDLVQEFPKRLALARLDKPLIIFLDALDQLSDTDKARDLAWLPADVPTNVHLIVSTLPGECLSALESRLPTQNRLEVQPMSVEDGKNILTEWLAGVCRQLEKKQEEYLLGKFQQCGLPLYLKLAFEEARLWKSYDALPELSNDISGILNDLFNRLSLDANHGGILVSRSLGYLAAAKNGLTEDELLDVLSLEREVMSDFQHRSPKSPKLNHLPAVIWSRMFYDVESYLTERAADGTSLLAFYHRQMREVVEEKYCSGNNKIARHRKLAEYFGNEKRPYWTNQEGHQPDRRKTSELAYQQAEAQLRAELKNTLTSFDFLQARLVASGSNALIADYDLAHELFISFQKQEAENEAEAISLIQDGLRLSSHVLSRDPDQLAAQLLGRLLGFRHPDIQNLLKQAEHWTDQPWLRPLYAYLTQPGSAERFTLAGLTAGVSAVAITSDGRLAALGSYDNIIKVWDLENEVELFTLTGHTDSVRAIAITSNGQLAVSGSADNTLKVWDLRKKINTMTLPGHAYQINAVAITPDGRLAVSGSRDKTLKVWDLDKGCELLTLAGHTDEVNVVDITPDGQLAVSGSTDNTIKVWDLRSGQLKTTLAGHFKSGKGFIRPYERLIPNYITALAITSDGKMVMSGSREGNLRISNLETGKERYTITSHTEKVNSLVITEDGRLAVSGSDDMTIKAWNMETGQEKFTIRGHSSGVGSLSITPDGHSAVSGSYDGTLKIWDLERESEKIKRDSHAGPVTAMAVTPDHRSLVSCSMDNTIKVWDLEDGKVKITHDLPDYIKEMSLTPDGHFAITSSFYELVQVRDLLSGGKRYPSSLGHEKIAVTPDGRLAISDSYDNSLKVWDLESGQEKFTLVGHTKSIGAVAITLDGRQAVSSSFDQTIKVWDLETGSEYWTFSLKQTESSAPAPTIAIAPNRLLVVCDYVDKIIKVLDLEERRELWTFPGNADGIYGIAISPDGQLAGVSSLDKELKVLDLIKGCERSTLSGHTYSVTSVAITPDGRFAVSSSTDKTIRIWDLESGNSVAAYNTDSMHFKWLIAEPYKIIIGDESGRMHFLQVENLNLGAYICTSWEFRGLMAFGCPHCRKWSEIPQSGLGSRIQCPKCAKDIKLNPFIIQGDWRPIANAWESLKSSLPYPPESFTP